VFKAILGVGTFLLGLLIGSFISLKSWEGVVYFYEGDDERRPAAIRKVFDFSHLKGIALHSATKRRLLEGARVTQRKHQTGIELGHFVVRGEKGQKKLACNEFKKIEMVFTAEGVYVNGEATQMIIEAPCRVGENVNRISTIWIPYEKLLQEPVADMEIQYLEDQPVFQFKNTGDRWPTRWQLKSMNLSSSEAQKRSVYIDSEEVDQILSRPLTMSWEDKRSQQ